MTHFLQDLWSAMHSLMLPRDKKRSIKNLVKYLDDNVNAHHIQKFGEQIGYCTKRKPEHKSMIQFFGIFFSCDDVDAILKLDGYRRRVTSFLMISISILLRSFIFFKSKMCSKEVEKVYQRARKVKEAWYFSSVLCHGNQNKNNKKELILVHR